MTEYRAAVNDGPWKFFPSYRLARRWLDRQIKRPTDTGWIRAVTDLTPTERAATP